MPRLSSKIALADTNILMYSVMQKIELIGEVKGDTMFQRSLTLFSSTKN